MVKESEDRIATAVAAAAASVAAPQRRSLTDKDDITGKIASKVIRITLCFAGLP